MQLKRAIPRDGGCAGGAKGRLRQIGWKENTEEKEGSRLERENVDQPGLKIYASERQ